jgi:endonuclease-8
MPEGPSIVILHEKAAYLKHKVVLEASGYADLDMDAIAQKKITDIKTWGKHFLICFNDFTIRIHFGLFGSYQLHEPKRINPKIALHFNDDALYFYVCTVKVLNQPLDEIYDWEADVMGDRWKPSKAFKKVRILENQQIADVLLDQKVFSGVGNIIKNEVLYRCKVHPESIVKHIPDTKLKAIIKECRLYSFDFLRWKKNNELSKHFEVYEQKKSKGTGKEVQRKETGKTKRSSYFINGEQKLYC